MNPSIQSAQPCRSLHCIGITTVHSWAWGHNVHCWVFLHLLEKFYIIFLVGRCSCNWRTWFGGGQWKYHTGTVGTWPWKMLLRSLSIYLTKMLSDSGMIPWLALVYSTLQSSPRCWTDIGQWDGWQLYDSLFWRLINILSLSSFWSYPSTSPLTLCPQYSSLCVCNRCPMFEILKSSDASWWGQFHTSTLTEDMRFSQMMHRLWYRAE